MEQRVWELASARLGQCSSFISNGKPFVTGFRPMLMKWELCHGNIYVVLKSERDWTEGNRKVSNFGGELNIIRKILIFRQ